MFSSRFFASYCGMFDTPLNQPANFKQLFSAEFSFGDLLNNLSQMTSQGIRCAIGSFHQEDGQVFKQHVNKEMARWRPFAVSTNMNGSSKSTSLKGKHYHDINSAGPSKCNSHFSYPLSFQN